MCTYLVFLSCIGPSSQQLQLRFVVEEYTHTVLLGNVMISLIKFLEPWHLCLPLEGQKGEQAADGNGQEPEVGAGRGREWRVRLRPTGPTARSSNGSPHHGGGAGEREATNHRARHWGRSLRYLRTRAKESVSWGLPEENLSGSENVHWRIHESCRSAGHPGAVRLADTHTTSGGRHMGRTHSTGTRLAAVHSTGLEDDWVDHAGQRTGESPVATSVLPRGLWGDTWYNAALYRSGLELDQFSASHEGYLLPSRRPWERSWIVWRSRASSRE